MILSHNIIRSISQSTAEYEALNRGSTKKAPTPATNRGLVEQVGA